MMFGRTERISRTDLYDLVWSTPMMTIAGRFRLSGNGLAKLCARHRIPVPDRGYWQRREAGNAPAPPRLPPASHELLESVEIHVKSDPNDWLCEEQIAEFDSRIAAEQLAANRIEVEDVLSRLPLVVSTRRALIGTPHGGPHLAMRVSNETRDRALRIAGAFVKACMTRGFALQSGKDSKAVDVQVCGESISFHFYEPTSRIEHVPTEKEHRERAAGRGWLIPAYDFVPTGKLQFIIDSYADEEQRTFSDTRSVRLEDRLNEVMTALLRTAKVLKARENYWAADRNACADEQRRRQEEEARKAAERRRRREILRAVHNFSRAESLYRLILAVESASSEIENEAVREWLAEARALADSLHPVSRILHPSGYERPTFER
jgi:hypothetical protein